MFTNINYISKNETHAIDMCNVQENCAWILDASDPLISLEKLRKELSGEVFIERIHTTLKNEMRQTMPLHDIVRHTMEKVIQTYQYFIKEEDLFDIYLPCACCAILKLYENELHYYVIGNCEIIATYEDGSIKSVTDLRLQVLDAKLLEISKLAKQERRMTTLQSRKFMQQMLVENRLRRNISDGYYVLGEDVEVISHGYEGVFPVKGLKHIMLVGNGFSKYMHCQKVKTCSAAYIFQERDQTFINVYDDLLKKQKPNIELAKYMQEQYSTKTTIVSFDVTNKYLLR